MVRIKKWSEVVDRMFESLNSQKLCTVRVSGRKSEEVTSNNLSAIALSYLYLQSQGDER